MQQGSDKPESGSTNEQPAKDAHITRGDLPAPKRGAFPTPKKEIESATPYVPGSDQSGEEPALGSVPQTNRDQKDTGRPDLNILNRDQRIIHINEEEK